MDDGVHSFGVSLFGGGVVWFSQGFFWGVAFLIMDRDWDDPGSSTTCL